MNRKVPSSARSQGSALLLSMVLLTALTLLGLAAVADGQLQVRVAGIQASVDQAERAADSALAWAERWLFSRRGDGRPDLCAAVCGAGTVIEDATAFPEHPEQANPDWWAQHGHPAGLDPVSGQTFFEKAESDPANLWVIGEIPVAAEHSQQGAFELGYYRVIARATDPTGKQVVVTESIVARPWGNGEWSDALSRPVDSPGLCQRHALVPCGRLAWRRLR